MKPLCHRCPPLKSNDPAHVPGPPEGERDTQNHYGGHGQAQAKLCTTVPLVIGLDYSRHATLVRVLDPASTVAGKRAVPEKADAID
jgi:hypothetical protein